MALKTNYQNDVFQGLRKYQMVRNDDGTYSFVDATSYDQEGDLFGANDINATNEAVNELMDAVPVTLTTSGWSSNEGGSYTQTVALDGITAEDMPLVLKYMAADISADDYTDYGTDFALISGGQCSAGSITFYATDVPSGDLTICLSLGKKGDGRLLLCGGGSGEKTEISNVVITLTDNAAVAEGAEVTAVCNGKSWSSTIKSGKAKLYTSEVGTYTITAVTTEGATITTMLVCTYFGQFSTDIYSGTLVVRCTEDGGNGKTCNVRSCDDEYNETDSYNLTQTFDTELELTFLGIPVGKYLVTVDDKYVFYKEIESIQNINSIDVCLRQYLYRDGDQCVYNCGGWMKGLVKTSTDTRYFDGGTYKSTGFAKASVAFYESYIGIVCNGYANTDGYVSTGSNTAHFARGTTAAYAHICTVGTIKRMSVFKNLYVNTANGQRASMRTGSANASDTSISTGTVITSGSANELSFVYSTENEDPYLVIGNANSYAGVGYLYGTSTIQTGSFTNVSYNNDATITEIYLV
jgi:hypothetical protein